MAKCTALKAIDEEGAGLGVFTQAGKSTLRSDTPVQQEAVRREFAAEGVVLNFFSGSPYLGSYLGTQEELMGSVKPLSGDMGPQG